MPTLSEILNDITGVVKTILNSSAITPNLKSDLSATLDTAVTNAKGIVAAAATGAETIIDNAPAEAAAATDVVVEDAANAVSPALAPVVGVVAPVAGDAVSALVSKFISTIEAHNTALTADLQKLASGQL